MHADGLGSVVANATSVATAERIQYQTYGQPFFIADGGTAVMDSIAGAPFAYTGREVDIEVGLHFLRARSLDFSIGRFISPDPIQYTRTPSTRDRTSTFTYVSNRPTTARDPTGLFIVLNPPAFGPILHPPTPEQPSYCPAKGQTNEILDQARLEAQKTGRDVCDILDDWEQEARLENNTERLQKIVQAQKFAGWNRRKRRD